MNPEDRKYILENIDKKSVKQIAAELHIKERKIKKFLETRKPVKTKHAQDQTSSLVLQVVILTFFFWLYHKLAVYVINTLKIKLGVIEPQAAPLYAFLRTSFDGWLIPAILTLSTYLIIFRLVFKKPRISAYIFIFVCILFMISIDTTVAMIDGGLKALVEPYTREGLEYYGYVSKVEGIRVFLRDFTKNLSGMPLHSQSHPPGGVLFLWIATKLFGEGLLTAALATIIFTSLSVIPVYMLAKELYGENVAKYASGLFLITPNMVMFTATSMDGPFSVFPILSTYLFYKALRASIRNQMVLYSVLTGIALGFAMFMNYTAVIIGMFFTATAIIMLIGKRDRFRTILGVLLITGATFALFYLFLYLWSGYNIFDALQSARKTHEICIGTGCENFEKYFHVSIANLFAFLIGVGIPTTAIWLHEIINKLRKLNNRSEIDIYIMASLATVLGISFSTLFALEVERIWLFMVPFIVIPAAKHLYERHRSRDFYVIAGLLCIQLLLTEIFLYTWW